MGFTGSVSGRYSSGMTELRAHRTRLQPGRCTLPPIWLGVTSLVLGCIASSAVRIGAAENAVTPQAAEQTDAKARELKGIEVQVYSRLLAANRATGTAATDDVDDLENEQAIANADPVGPATHIRETAFDELFFGGAGAEQITFRRRSLDQILQHKLDDDRLGLQTDRFAETKA